MSAAADEKGQGAGSGERRSNVVLRALVNEMLDRVRDLSRRTEAWTPEERAQAEADLEMIMERVRQEAMHPHDRG